jgi:hypothetical protein
VPLDEPVRVRRTHPFTKQPIEVLEWDPNPEESVEDRGPSALPGPAIDCKGLGPTSVASLIAIVHNASKETEERFYRRALIGPETGPVILELPAAFVAKLAALDEAGRSRVAQEWSARERSDLESIPNRATREAMLARHDAAYWSAMLGELARFAEATVSEGRGMYMWLLA